MPLKVCEKCGREINSDARACPHCGTLVRRDRRAVFFGAGIVVTLSIFSFLTKGENGSSDTEDPARREPNTLVVPSVVPRSPAPASASPLTSGPAKTNEASGFQSTRMNVWPGKKLYLKTDHVLIGEVVYAESSHRFPDGTVAEGVQIRFSLDQSVDWIPRETVHRLYVTK